MIIFENIHYCVRFHADFNDCKRLNILKYLRSIFRIKYFYVMVTLVLDCQVFSAGVCEGNIRICNFMYSTTLFCGSLENSTYVTLHGLRTLAKIYHAVASCSSLTLQNEVCWQCLSSASTQYFFHSIFLYTF